MPLVIRTPDGETAVTIRCRDHDATVAAVTAALAGLVEPGLAAPDVAGALRLSIDGAELDPALPWPEAAVADGTTVDLAPVRLGAPRWQPVTRRASMHADVPVPAGVAPVRVPSPPAPPVAGAPLSLAGLLVPLVMAGVMVAVLGNRLWALFALLGPITVLASWGEQRHRGWRGHRRARRQWDEDLRRLADDLGRAANAERERREERLPDSAAIVQRATGSGDGVWTRSPHHRDWLTLRLGTGPAAWTVPLAAQPGAPEVARMVDGAAELPEAPVDVCLDEATLGITGDRDAALALVRSLVVQAAAHHSPGALSIALTAEPTTDWAWARWLPHLTACNGTVLRVVDAGTDPVDDAPRTATIVVAPDDAALPPGCRSIVAMSGAGTARLHRPGRTSIAIMPEALATRDAELAARGLAGFGKPASYPEETSWLDLCDLSAPSADAVTTRWAAGAADPSPQAVAGTSASTSTPVVIDLAADGPHALIAGTTGSGKSELLRTLVAGLALSSPPEALAFVLIDFKGGAAFDRCAELPHVVAVVTDLDGHLVARAVRGLDAELRRREHVLREAGVSDLTALRRLRGEAAMPRLVVVVDEFATLAAAHPDALAALVGLAQRGRSLGLHLVLATQRPGGAVNDQIRANTNLRIALRVQDRADSLDVVGVPDAALVDHRSPGRGVLRRAASDVIGFDTSHVTAPTTVTDDLIRIEPFGPATPTRISRALARSTDVEPPAESQLDQVIAAVCSAHEASGRPRPRAPWPPPLPDHLVLELERVTASRTLATVPFALADDIDHQCQRELSWQPASGNLLVTGAPRRGTTTALTTIALSLAASVDPSRCHLYALDMGSGELDALTVLPHVGAVVHAGEFERQRRLVQRLDGELTRRRSNSGAAHPHVVLLLDGLAAFSAAWPDPLVPVGEQLARVAGEGGSLGIHLAVSTGQISTLPRRWLAALPHRFALASADAADATVLGLPSGALDGLPPGRGWWLDDRLVAQVRRVEDVESAVRTLAARADPRASDDRPPPITTMPLNVDRTRLHANACPDGTWHLAAGIGDTTLQPVALTLHPGEHALIAGPARSGRSTALVTLAYAAARLAGTAQPHVVAVATSRSPLASAAVDQLVHPDALGRLGLTPGRPTLVLVDDADEIDDDDGVLAPLLAHRDPAHRVIAAGRADALRRAFGHWTRGVRASGTGILLRPSLDLDGELLGVTLPRRLPCDMAPGRGWLVAHGDVEYVQVAT